MRGVEVAKARSYVSVKAKRIERAANATNVAPRRKRLSRLE